MLGFRKIKLNKAKIFFQGLPRKLAEKSFPTFFILFLISLIFGGLLFYQYGILSKKVKIEITEKPLQFKEKTYQGVLKIWQDREKRFEEAGLNNYPDLFKGLTK